VPPRSRKTHDAEGRGAKSGLREERRAITGRAERVREGSGEQRILYSREDSDV
jgi:hypothetical protein